MRKDKFWESPSRTLLPLSLQIFFSDTARQTLMTCDSGRQPGVFNETHVI